jgi:hypothetical protein
MIPQNFGEAYERVKQLVDAITAHHQFLQNNQGLAWSGTTETKPNRDTNDNSAF